MKFTEALFNLPNISVFQIIEDKAFFNEDFTNWTVTPIDTPILTVEPLSNNFPDGYFILKALSIAENGITQHCFLDVSMPERISEKVFFKDNNQIICEDNYQLKGEVIPLVAIDGFGLYELYYSRKNPEIGIKVLRNGLNFSKRKKYIAMDLAYILRDEKRFEEAVQAFSISIEEGADNEYVYLERASLFEELGDKLNAEKDRNSARKFAQKIKL